MYPEQPNIKINCPHCGAQWCPAEIDAQECFICGHPEPYDKENDDETED